MLDYDPKTGLRHHPTSMAKFGLNPFQENLYRIIFAPSRRHIVYGEWRDGSRRASWVKTYAALGDVWVMERWHTAFEFTRMTEQSWNESMTVLGIYPSRGEYEICHIFEACAPEHANLDKLVMWIEAGRNRSFSENRTACQQDADRREKETSAEVQDRIRDILPAFGTAPLIGYGGGRGTKTMPITKSAEELGLPTSPTRKNLKLRNPPTYEIPLEA